VQAERGSSIGVRYFMPLKRTTTGTLTKRSNNTMSEAENAKQTEPTPSDNDKVVPFVPDDALDIESMYVDPLIPGGAITRVTQKVSVGRPNKEVFYRSHPDDSHHRTVYLIVEASTNSSDEISYWIDPRIAGELAYDAKYFSLSTLIDREGNVRLCRARLPKQGERDNLYAETMRMAIQMAKEYWVRIIPNQITGRYDTLRADRGYAEDPDWSKVPPFDELMMSAFGPDGIIRRLDHPVVHKRMGRRQRGE
jgi:hypothetical protein